MAIAWQLVIGELVAARRVKDQLRVFTQIAKWDRRFKTVERTNAVGTLRRAEIPLERLVPVSPKKKRRS